MSGETRGLMFDSPLGEFMRYTRGVIEHFTPLKGEDTNAYRKARKERARMLTRLREEELRVQRLSQENRAEESEQ